MSKRGQWAEMADVVPDEAVLDVGVAAPIDKLGQAIKDRYGNRVQRVGFYTVGSTMGIDPDALQQVITDLQS